VTPVQLGEQSLLSGLAVRGLRGAELVDGRIGDGKRVYVCGEQFGVSILRELVDVMIRSAALARLAQPDMAEVIPADEGALDARVSCGRSRTSGAGAWRFSR